MTAARLWVESPSGVLFLVWNFDRALVAIYPDRYGLDSPDRPTRQEQRDAIALRAATELQGFAMLSLADDGLFDPEVESEEILTAIFSDRTRPAPLVAWGWPPGERLPLILTSSAVAARSREEPRSEGVTVINSSSARRLIHSLAELGVVRFGFL